MRPSVILFYHVHVASKVNVTEVEVSPMVVRQNKTATGNVRLRPPQTQGSAIAQNILMAA